MPNTFAFDPLAINGFDIALLLIVIISGIFGIARGFVASFLSTTGWVAAILINDRVFAYIQPLLQQRFQSTFITVVVGYVGGLLVLLIGFAILNFMLNNLLKSIRLGVMDRSLGLVFGIVRGLALAVFFFICFKSFVSLISGKADLDSAELPEFMKLSQSLPILDKVEKITLSTLPELGILKSQGDADKRALQVVYLINKLSSHRYITPDVLQKIVEEAGDGGDKNRLLLDELWRNYQRRLAQGEVTENDQLSGKEEREVEELLSVIG